MVRGVRIVHGRARGVFRLQKSTGGARRFALDGVNLRRARSGLARSCASIGERRSVGSWIAAAKPRDQWRARTDHRASGLRTCTRRWKSLWVVGTATVRKRLSKCSRSPLTRGRERSGPWRRRCRTCPATAARQRVTEVSVAQPYTRSKTPRYGSTARSGTRLFYSKRSWATDPKLDGRRQTRIDLGPFRYSRRNPYRDRKGAGRRKREGRTAPAVR